MDNSACGTRRDLIGLLSHGSMFPLEVALVLPLQAAILAPGSDRSRISVSAASTARSRLYAEAQPSLVRRGERITQRGVPMSHNTPYGSVDVVDTRGGVCLLERPAGGGNGGTAERSVKRCDRGVALTAHGLIGQRDTVRSSNGDLANGRIQHRDADIAATAHDSGCVQVRESVTNVK